MDDELNLDSDETINRTQERIKDLSSKARGAFEERDAANAKAEAEATARVTAEKERDFYASFTQSTSKFPAAAEYTDKIKEKVMAGYTVDDAVVAVLNNEGKLTTMAPIATPPPPAAGGSAVNNLPSSGATKTVAEMSRDEKRQGLIDAEKRGDISLNS